MLRSAILRIPNPFIAVLTLMCLVACGAEEQSPPTTTDKSVDYRAGARQLQDSIDAIIAGVNFLQHPYETRRKLAVMEQMVQRAIEQRQINANQYLIYGQTLLEAGESQKAIDVYESIMEKLPENKAILPETKVLHEALALGYLRRGEQLNCIEKHTPVSCIFPIQPEAVHTLPESSQKAIEIYERILAVFPDDLRSRWLLNLAYQTIGGYPQDVPRQWLMGPDLFQPDADFPSFTNISMQLDVAVHDLAGGVIIDDFNGDGYLDIIASSWDMDGTLRYFINQQDGSFVDQTTASGLDIITGGLNMVQADYDNDGDLDFYVLRSAWSIVDQFGQLPNSLVRNNGDGTFSDVTIAADMYAAEPSQAAVWLDYDQDGWLDLFVSNETATEQEQHPCHLYRNLQDGTFRDVASNLGLDVSDYIKGVNAGDVNNDGRPDLYLSILTGPNKLFLNEGGVAPEQWKFREVAAAAGVTKPQESFPTWFFDYDNDGDEDLFVVNFDIHLLKQQAHETAADYLGLPLRSAYSCLYRNDGEGRFTDVTKEMGLDRILTAMGCNYGDLDNDGFPDFYLGTGAPDFRAVVPNRMFRNAGGERFQDVTYAGGFGHIQKGHGISFADVNNDGDQDVYAVMGGSVSGDVFQNAFFENPGNTNNWLTLRLEGTTANRSAIGTRIRLSINNGQAERMIYKTVNSGASFGANSLQAEIGLGPNVQEVQLSINWPDGQNQWISYGSIPFDQVLSVKQGEQDVKKVDIKPFAFAEVEGGHQHHHEH
ncbi:MAG: FG-GAP-like repeat-containing protein [Bacteroidota bacterium]